MYLSITHFGLKVVPVFPYLSFRHDRDARWSSLVLCQADCRSTDPDLGENSLVL